MLVTSVLIVPVDTFAQLSRDAYLASVLNAPLHADRMRTSPTIPQSCVTALLSILVTLVR